MKQNETPEDVPDAVPPASENGSGADGGNASAKPPARPGGKPPLSRERLQQARRKWLRTILLTGGVTGAALSGFLPLVYARTKKISSPPASSAGNVSRSARCRRSSWPT